MWKYSLVDLGADWFMICRKKGSKKQYYSKGVWGLMGSIFTPKLEALKQLRRIIQMNLKVIEGLINDNQETMPTV